MTISEAIQWGHKELLFNSNSARLDSEVLLSHALAKESTFLLAHDDEMIGFWDLRKYKKLILRRKVGEPVAYLTGHKEFFFLDLEVNKHVLVPRPDTELLVESVIEYIASVRRDVDVAPSVLLLDVGTGTGCIPIAVVNNVEGLKAIATDVSTKALKVAQRNIKKHHLQSRIRLIKSDLLESVGSRLFSGKELIVTANLPYLPYKMMEVNQDLKFEPHLALHGGEDGMDVYKRLVDQLFKLKPKAIFFELFDEQIAILKTHLPGYELKHVKNMTGNARVLVMERD